ncbi:MAG: HNH endonuclease [Candidatus Hodarchaeales archaeon]|jgi:5-methylcytosine-specific restriction endonuclease McrA
MTYSNDDLRRIYGKTNGYCTFCEIKLSFTNYGSRNICAKGAWEVDHGMPLSRGGTDDFRNLQPACSLCNREKGDKTTTEFRREVARYSSPQNFHIALRRKYCQ